MRRITNFARYNNATPIFMCFTVWLCNKILIYLHILLITNVHRIELEIIVYPAYLCIFHFDILHNTRHIINKVRYTHTHVTWTELYCIRMCIQGLTIWLCGAEKPRLYFDIKKWKRKKSNTNRVNATTIKKEWSELGFYIK
jgi:hypothetical protein